jgi:hypothetical protein
VNQVNLRQAMAELFVGEPRTPIDVDRALGAGRAARRTRRAKFGAAGAVLTVALVAAFPGTRSFVLGDRAQPGPAQLQERKAPYDGYPDSIAVIGVVTANGGYSDPANPGATVPENSWVTGTNPAVNSLYQRILAHNDRIEGNRSRFIDDQVVAAEVLPLAERVVAQSPPPDLVVMQVLDQNMACPASPQDLDLARRNLVQALQFIEERAPYTRVFMVSQFGSPTTYVQSLTLEQRVAAGEAFADFNCVVVDRRGEVIQENLDSFEAAIHGYEATIKGACDEFTLCGYDEGAFGNTVEQPGDIGHDLSHLSIQGQAKAAAVAWKALQDLRFLPAD